MSAKVLGVIVGGCLMAAPAVAQPASTARAEAEARQQRYQISTLERVIEGAVEHALAVTRDRLQAAISQMPTELFVSDNAHARGFRLEGYGVFFDVMVPTFDATFWTLRTLDQNDLGYDSAVKELQQVVKGNSNAEEALRRLQLNASPMSVRTSQQQTSALTTDARLATGSTASAPVETAASKADPVLTAPSEAYREEVIQALKDAMLDHSSSLGIQPNEWLTIAGRGNDDRPRLAPADSVTRTRILRLRGSDLAAYLARQITKQEAMEKIEIKVY